MNNYILTLINRMAMATHTTLTERHMKILEYAYLYYKKNRVGPVYYNLKKKFDIAKNELSQLFPHGLNSVYTWVGIPIQSTNSLCKPPAKVHVDHYREVYFDHNATTYIRDEVIELLSAYNNGELGFANPSSSTLQGQEAYELINKAREDISALLQCTPEEIIFTGSGSEANNFAIKGIASRYLGKKAHIITSSIEHSSVIKSVEYLKSIGFDVTFIDPEKDGIINPENVRKAIKPHTILVSIMAVNNEIGTINPINEIGKICRILKIPFMVDAVQGFGKIPLLPFGP